MTWRDNLRPASFRGVRFHVRDRDLDSGRRLEVHEFPKRDTPFPEDMGKATREFSVSAYVIGDDYMARRDALLKACEKEGPGSYVDHWGLSQRAACRRITLMESSEEGRFCSFRLEFIEAGGGAMPVAIAATAAQLVPAAAAVAAAATAAFAAIYRK